MYVVAAEAGFVFPRICSSRILRGRTDKLQGDTTTLPHESQSQGRRRVTRTQSWKNHSRVRASQPKAAQNCSEAARTPMTSALFEDDEDAEDGGNAADVDDEETQAIDVCDFSLDNW